MNQGNKDFLLIFISYDSTLAVSDICKQLKEQRTVIIIGFFIDMLIFFSEELIDDIDDFFIFSLFEQFPKCLGFEVKFLA
jgi:hypothetical protein